MYSTGIIAVDVVVLVERTLPVNILFSLFTVLVESTGSTDSSSASSGDRIRLWVVISTVEFSSNTGTLLRKFDRSSILCRAFVKFVRSDIHTKTKQTY